MPNSRKIADDALIRLLREKDMEIRWLKNQLFYLYRENRQMRDCLGWFSFLKECNELVEWLSRPGAVRRPALVEASQTQADAWRQFAGHAQNICGSRNCPS